MKLEKAREIGIECGLNLDCEHVNNIIMHCGNIFAYSEMREEINELICDAKNSGVYFAKCGCADLEPNREYCYLCIKLNNVK